MPSRTADDVYRSHPANKREDITDFLFEIALSSVDYDNMKEIITLQFGDYAHWVGAHFWNIQDELLNPAYASSGGIAEFDPQVLFRTSTSRAGEPTYTPRALLYDVRDSVGLSRVASAWHGHGDVHTGEGVHGPAGAYGPGHDEDTVPGLPGEIAARVHASARARLPRSRFQQRLAEVEAGTGPASYVPSEWARDVYGWGDIAKASFHPKSLLPVGARTAAGDTLGSSDASTLSVDSAFDAFNLGAQLANEELVDPFRTMLEECDHVQGVQAVVDIDSGFGGLGARVLNDIQEDLGHVPIIVLGVARPMKGYTGPQAHGEFPYRVRDRLAVRDINLGMAFAEFAGTASDLRSTFVPLSMQACAELVTGPSPPRWTAGLRMDSVTDAYHSSALLAAAWDTWLSPVRVNSDFADAVLDSSRVCKPEHLDTTKHRPGGDPHFDPIVELSADPPMVALRGDVTLTDVVRALTPIPSRRIINMGMALPFSHARCTATRMACWMHNHVAPHQLGVSHLLPLSWFYALPHAYVADWQAIQGAPTPFAHMMVTRGVGAHVLSSAGDKYASGLDAYGRSIEKYLARSMCAQAVHACRRTPMPVPIGFPGLLDEQLLDAVGDVRPVSQSETEEASAISAPEVPYSVPVALHAHSGPAYAPAIRRIRDAFGDRDLSVLHRFQTADTAAGSIDMESTASALAQLYDDYCAEESV